MPEHITEKCSSNRASENHYPTMTLEAVCALRDRLHNRCIKNVLLLLWATSPKLREAMAVLDAWEFEYKTCAVWDKGRMGLGYYFRQQHELLLIATRGKVHSPRESDRSPSIFRSPRAKYSEKPDCVYEIIEKWYPTAAKLEMFQRKPRAGWHGWGTQEHAEIERRIAKGETQGMGGEGTSGGILDAVSLA